MVSKVPLALMICVSPDHESRRLSDVLGGGGQSMTDGVPDTGRWGLGRASSSSGGEVGAGRRAHPLWTKAMIHPVAEVKEGGMSASSRRLHKRYTSDLPGPRPTCINGLELTQADPKARIHDSH